MDRQTTVLLDNFKSHDRLTNESVCLKCDIVGSLHTVSVGLKYLLRIRVPESISMDLYFLSGNLPP